VPAGRHGDNIVLDLDLFLGQALEQLERLQACHRGMLDKTVDQKEDVLGRIYQAFFVLALAFRPRTMFLDLCLESIFPWSFREFWRR